MNLVSNKVYSQVPTVKALQLALGQRADSMDLSFYKIPGNEFAGLYETDQVQKFLNFEVSVDLQTMKINSNGSENG
jgi:hypothetical protein